MGDAALVMAAERPPLVVYRRGGFLAPATPMDGDMLAKFSPTAPITVRLTQERHGGQHRLYFALLGKVCENLDTAATAEELHEWVKTNTRVIFTDRVTGELFETGPASVAFEAMDQPAFHDFFRRVIDLLVSRIIPGLDKQALRQEAAALLGFAA